LKIPTLNYLGKHTNHQHLLDGPLKVHPPITDHFITQQISSPSNSETTQH